MYGHLCSVVAQIVLRGHLLCGSSWNLYHPCQHVKLLFRLHEGLMSIFTEVFVADIAVHTCRHD